MGSVFARGEAGIRMNSERKGPVSVALTRDSGCLKLMANLDSAFMMDPLDSALVVDRDSSQGVISR